MAITIDGMRETIFGKLISEYAPEELREQFFYNITVFIEENGNFWFVGSEVATRMGYSNTRDAIARHVPEQYKRLTVVKHDGQGGAQNVILISELGLYALAMKSQLPQALYFQDWVYRVLSKIRAHGGYMSPHPYLKQIVDIIPVHLRGTFSNMRGKISEQQQMIENLNRQLEEQQGKVAFYDLAMDSSNVVPITVIAKDFGMTANYLHSILSNAEIIYRVGDTWVLHKDYQNQGFTASKSRVTLTDIDGTVHENCEIATYWTERGRAFIYNNLMARGYKPLYLES